MHGKEEEEVADIFHLDRLRGRGGRRGGSDDSKGRQTGLKKNSDHTPASEAVITELESLCLRC